MREQPILFSGPMVRAILDGRKTVTRRVLKGAWQAALEGHDRVKTWFAPPDVPAQGIPNEWAESGIWAEKWGPRGYNRFLGFSPYRPADRLWVREAWRCNGWAADVATIFYRASEGDGYTAMCEQYPVADHKPLRVTGGWRPSIHMPRWASRITLEVTGLKVERLHGISDEDAIAEGCPGRLGPNPDFPDEWDPSPQEEFREVWTSINGHGSWEANPWVVAVTFRVLDQKRASAGGCDEGPPSACAGGASP